MGLKIKSCAKSVPLTLNYPCKISYTCPMHLLECPVNACPHFTGKCHSDNHRFLHLQAVMSAACGRVSSSAWDMIDIQQTYVECMNGRIADRWMDGWAGGWYVST